MRSYFGSHGPTSGRGRAWALVAAALMSGAVCLGVLLLQDATAWAAPRPEGGEAKAMRLFAESEKDYRAGRFADAVKKLEEARKLAPREAVLTYNLGRALDGMGEFPRAISEYERYLREMPNVPDRGAIEQRIATLQRQVQRDRDAAEAERRRQEAEARAREQPAVAASAPALDRAPPRMPSKAVRIVPWVIAGVGVALVAGGVGAGGHARDLEGQANREMVQTSAARLLSDAQSAATASNALVGTGAALAAAGVVWGIVTAVQTRRARRAGVAAAPTPNGFAVAVGGSF